MRLLPSLRWWWLGLLLCCSQGLAMTTISVHAARWPGLAVQDLRAQLTDQGRHRIHLDMQVVQLSVARLGWHRLGLKVNGELAADAGGRWQFSGQVQGRGVTAGSWSQAQLQVLVDTLANSVLLTVVQSPTHVSLAIPLDEPGHWQLDFTHLPALWLGPVANDGHGSELVDGDIDGQLAVDWHRDGLQASGIFTTANLALNLPRLGFKAEGLTGSAQLNTRLDAEGRLLGARLQAGIDGGRWNLQGWPAELSPGHRANLDLQLDGSSGGLTQAGLRWDDPATLHFDSQWQFDAKGHVRELAMDHLQVGLPQAYQEYGHWWQRDKSPPPHLLAGGQVSGSLVWRQAGWRELSLRFHDLSLSGAELPLEVSHLRGGLDWSAHGSAAATTLEWQQLVIAGQDQPAGHSQWQTRNGTLHLLGSWDLQLWAGRLHLDELRLTPQAGAVQWSAAASLQAVRADALSHLLGGPALPGSLSIAALSMHGLDRQLYLDHPVSVDLLGGQVSANAVQLQLPAADQPARLAANVQFKHLDLQAITGMFEVGTISGSIDGHLDGLQMLQGQGPQAFQLSMRSEQGGRISQRAIAQIAALTDSSSASGLQGMLLHVFHSPVYTRLGVDAKLKNGVLYLNGLEHDNHGYTLIEGKGMPFTRLLGRQTQIPWQQAVQRIRVGPGPRQPLEH